MANHRLNFTLDEEYETLLKEMRKFYNNDMTIKEYFIRALDLGLSDLFQCYLDEKEDEGQ